VRDSRNASALTNALYDPSTSLDGGDTLHFPYNSSSFQTFKGLSTKLLDSKQLQDQSLPVLVYETSSKLNMSQEVASKLQQKATPDELERTRMLQNRVLYKKNYNNYIKSRKMKPLF
jgi:hypothetical protein